MKYICRECGLSYNKKPNFCECGNDTFFEGIDDVEPSREQRAEERAKRYAKNKAKVLKRKRKQNRSDDSEEKTSPFTILFAFVLIGAVAFFLPNFVQNKAKEANERAAKESEATYLDRTMKTILADFTPAGITKTDYCIIKFEINESGWISKRSFEHRSSVAEINSKVMYALKKSTIIEKPPKKYIDVPIKIRVSCTADEKTAECLSNIYTETK